MGEWDAVAGPLLSLTGVAKRFPDRTVAIQDSTLTVDDGEFVSVVGPSGCGKTTLLRIVSGLVAPTSGDVYRGTDDIGYVFQDDTLLPWRTVQRNVELPAELRGLPRDERRRRAGEAIARVGLAGFARHRPRTLSGGMRMRVSLARALTLRPKLFLFDEPLGALDEITRARLGDELQSLYTAERFAALFVTHSVAEAVYLSTRVLVMSPRPGRIVADIPVPLDYPRPPQARYAPGLVAVAARVSAALRGDLIAGDPGGGDPGPDPRDPGPGPGGTVREVTAE
jgi:NitT/TauT family transport system ATP-binding protein